jgi:RNA-directed DNA polymerase
MVAALGTERRVREYRVRRFLLADEGFTTSCLRLAFAGLDLHAMRDIEPEMQPLASCHWQVPAIVTTGDLARWLEVQMSHLLWFADARTSEARTPEGPLRHYRYRWVSKRSGGARLIESPKLQVKTVQRQILHQILDAIPPHPAAHAFRCGRGTTTFAAPHVGQAMVLKIDLKDFFPTITRSRVTAVFMLAGYPESVAAMLANLSVKTTPGTVLLEQDRAQRRLYQRPHLAQGAPTSPVFSGGPDFARCVKRFHIQALSIVMEEGFRPNTRKTKFMSRSASQCVAGIMVNTKLNTPRHEYESLKALLHNCKQHGPHSQNHAQHPEFRAHLAGRIAQVAHVNAARGEKLRRSFDEIDWGL